MDKSTYLDENNNQKFKTCPFTRENLEIKAYPLIFLKKKLVEWRLIRFDKILDLAEAFNDDSKEVFYKFLYYINLSYILNTSL